MDFPLTPYFLYFHYFGPAVAHSHFSTSYTAHGFSTSLFPGSFRPVCFLKAHLFISWACDPLFLLLGFNGFSIHLLILFCPCCWASSFYWASQNNHQHQLKIKKEKQHIGNPQTQQSKTLEPRNPAIADHGAILLFALTEHRASMGRRLEKSYGFALGKSDGLMVSGRGDGSARMEEEREKIKGRMWASTEDLGWLEEERKKQSGGGWRLNRRRYERKKKEKKT